VSVNSCALKRGNIAATRVTMRAMPAFSKVYTDAQRDALAEAVVDRGLRPAQVVELAAAGELRHAGERLAAFPANVNSVRDYARKLKARRAGRTSSGLDDQAPRDAIETLRRRLVNAAEQEIAAEERKPRGKRSLERLRQCARLLREAAALPGPDDPRPTQPGQKIPGTQKVAGGKTTGGMAGAILSAAGRSGRVETRQTQPAPSPIPPSSDVEGEQHGTHTDTGSTDHTPSGEPGAWAREQVGAPPL
jgi:hypothetical protein